MENPYWHPEVKPHVVNPDEVRLLAFDIFGIVRTSMGMAGDGIEKDEDEDTEPTSLELVFYNLAEVELSKKLLRVAVLMRTLDDYWSDHEDYAEAVSTVTKDAGIGILTEKDDTTDLTLREACNKIIHATDVRPVYDTDDEKESKAARWGMDGQLELEGSFRGKDWTAMINLIPLLEAIVDVADKIDDLQS